MSERFKNILAYAGIVFNVIVGAASIYTLATDITSAPWGITFIIVAILGICAGVALIVDKAYKPLSDKVVSLTEGYISFSEVFNSESFRLTECFHNNEQNPQEFKMEILTGCHNLVKETYETLHNALGKKVRVCIKMFVDDSKDYVFTYCRDSLTVDQSIKREHKKTISVKNNSDFSDIMSNNKDYFIGSTLQKDFKEGKYHNTNKDFKYESAVVVPIRVLANAITDDNVDFYDTVGFLCVDSKKKHLFDNGQAQMCVNLIQSVAQLLYVFISHGNEYYNSIVSTMNEEEENNG